MKLRIKGDSIRFRLTVPEVKALEEEGQLVSAIHFGKQRWVYSLSVEAVDNASARLLENGGIHVSLPETWIKGWLASPKVGFEARQENGTREGLHILVEKDFACLTERPEEDESEHFPNPLAGESH